ncbi:MAG: amidohydrolase [Planctomycetota bacterium]
MTRPATSRTVPSLLVLLAVLLAGALACDSLYEGSVDDDVLRKMEPGQVPTADLILLVERVHDLVEPERGGNAIAIQGDRILAVTDRVGVLRFRGAATRIREYPGAHAFPGLVDAHGHLLGLGASLEELALGDLRDLHDLVARVAATAASRPKGSWILGRGWDQNRWPDKAMPDHHELSLAVPDHPVLLTRVDGHAVLANAKALALAGIDARTPDPDGGRILRDGAGEPTGVLVDYATSLVARLVPPTGLERVDARLLAAQEHLLSLGLTRVHDAGIGPIVRRRLEALRDAGAWTLGVYGMLTPPAGGLPDLDESPPEALLRFRAVKLYADGALGSRGAALLAPYADEPGTSGLLVTPPEELLARIREARAKGYQPCVHAIGDRANRIVLEAYREVYGAGLAKARPRIEHVQVLAPEDLEAFPATGVVASMQPTHLTSDMPWAPARLGPARIAGAYAFRTLADAGAPLAFGSDFPVEPASPFEGLFAAVTTVPPRDPRGAPLRPDQRMPRLGALRAFVLGPAFAAFEEDVRGRVRGGWVADLTIVDRDLVTVPDEALLGTLVLATVVAGRLAWEPAGAGGVLSPAGTATRSGPRGPGSG